MKGFSTLLLACLAPAGAAFAQEAWPPPLPAFDFSRPAPRPPEGEALDSKVLDPGLAILMKNDVNGLGAQAALVARWSAGRGDARLIERGGSWSLSGADGSAAPLSPALGSALRHMNQYFGLTGPTLSNPISHAELEVSFLTPESVAFVRSIFDRSMDERLTVGGKFYLPELGGEATLDSKLHFHFNADPLRPTLRELIARRNDPAALARLFDEAPEKMALIDPQGILKRHLGVRARWDAEDRIPKERRDAALRSAVDTVAELAAGHYSSDYANQLRTMIGDEWSGRYAGPWHCHPPDAGPNGWLGDAPPSEADYEASAKAGQEIVVAFLPDGFDVYDLSQAPNGSPYNNPAKPFSYRSQDWREHFQEIFERIARPAPAP
ncbi:MAG: hypothetical protein ACHQ51_04560 [Elusimicrobiota bacterium]